MTISESFTPPVLPVATLGRTWSWLTADLRRRRAATGVAIVVGLFAAGLTTVPIYLLGSLVDRVSEGDDARSLVGLSVVIGVTALMGGLGTGLSTYLVTRLGEHTVADLREDVLERALNLPATTIEEAGRGDLLSRVGADVGAVAKAVSQVLPEMINSFFLGVVTIVGMTSIDWRLGLAGALSIPAYATALWWYLPRSAPMYAENRVALAARAQASVESIQGFRTIDAYETHGRHLGEIDRQSARARDVSVGVFTLFTRLVGRVNRAEFIGLSATLIVGFLLAREDMVTVGAVTAAALMFHRLFNPIRLMMYNFDELQAGAACLARLVGVVDLPVDSDRPGSDRPDSDRPDSDRNDFTAVATPDGADVEIDGVSFAYNAGPEVVQDVSLRIPAGTRCALVGTTGAGKTTLAAVVAGLLAPTRGETRIGGVAVGRIEPGLLRHWVATITQEVHVFSGPLVEDLRLVAPDAERDEIWSALDKVGAAGWVKALEEGLDTEVGEQGLTLTAAQAQHIAMARLVLADPRVVVLDEATAEAGSAHAVALEDAATAATKGRTTLVVAHRLTQAATADQIAVMADGRIVENGTHAELLAADGRYARLWAAWSTHG